jgi:hypothetical protein
MKRDQIEAMLDRMVQSAGENDAQVAALAEFVSVAQNLQEETHDAEDRRIYDLYLSKVSVILAKVIQDEPIGNDISSMERLFGNTWLKDGDAYSKAYSAWDNFKSLFRQSIHGMTVNERLFVLGLLDEFDSASAKKSRCEMQRVLSKCLLTPENVQAIIESELKK